MNLTLVRHIVLIFLLLTAVSCQQERLSIIDEQEDNNIIEDADLMFLVQGVTAHDGSHDDIVDNSSCFSIDFPYQLKVNGELRTITQVNDLASVYDYDEIEPIYPLQITFADYTDSVINSSTELNTYIAGCSNGTYYNEGIDCIDIIYPVSMAEYNPETREFQTLVYDHDRITFTGLRRMLSEGSVVQIQFPVQIEIVGGETLQIESNQQLKAIISSNLDFCF